MGTGKCPAFWNKEGVMSENTLFIAENPCEKAATEKLSIGLDDLILTQDMPTSAGSKMLTGYKSLFAARVDER